MDVGNDPKKAVAVFDGFNVYHALNTRDDVGNYPFRKYKWLNLRVLSQCFLPANCELEKVIYFTAFAPWDAEKRRKHRDYIKALSSVSVETVLGKFMRRTRKCKASCRKIYPDYEEKRTDVNLALYLFKMALDKEYDVALLFSADSDLAPAVSLVQERFPEKAILIIPPIGSRSFELEGVSKHRFKEMKEKHLKHSQFPDKLKVEGQILERPESWR